MPLMKTLRSRGRRRRRRHCQYPKLKTITDIREAATIMLNASFTSQRLINNSQRDRECVERIAALYGISPNRRAEIDDIWFWWMPLSDKETHNADDKEERDYCIGCRWAFGDPRKCPLHGTAMDLLLERYYRRFDISRKDEPEQPLSFTFVAEMIDDFRDAYVGIKWETSYLQHGWFHAQCETWIRDEHVSILNNPKLYNLFPLEETDLHHASMRMPITCMYRTFGLSSFFMMFNDGKYFLLGHEDDIPDDEKLKRSSSPKTVSSIQFFKDFIEKVDKALKATYADIEEDEEEKKKKEHETSRNEQHRNNNNSHNNSRRRRRRRRKRRMEKEGGSQ